MKVLFFVLFITSTLHAGIDSLHYKILPGKYHQGGTLEALASKIDTVKNTMDVLVKYDVIKKPMIPAPASVLKNQMVLELPLDFQDERGYIDLELSKTRDTQYATIVHAGRVNVGKLIQAHHVQIVGKNGKYVCDVIYHPSIPELGWPEIKLILNLSILSNYEMKAELK